MMGIASTKSEISEISAPPTIQIIAIILSTVTQAVEEMKNDLKATEQNRAKREVKAIKSRIQRGKVEKKERAEEEKRREVIQKADKKRAAAIRRKDKEEAEESNKIARKEIQHRIDEANKRQMEQTQSTNALMATMVKMIQASNSTVIARVADTEKGIKETAEKERERRRRGIVQRRQSDIDSNFINIVQRQNE